jgi:CHASE2 domain-containing sensor protein
MFHWGGVAFLIALGIHLGGVLEHHRVWLRERYRVTQGMHDLARWISGKKAYDKHTTVVLIGDEEFWGPELARRSPLNRGYLARLIRSLNGFSPRVIALDVYLLSPRPDGSVVDYPAYAVETLKLFEAVREVGSQRSVILLRSIGFRDGYYVYESDVYNEETFSGTKVSVGHYYFEQDYRMIPLSVVLRDGTQVYSFSGAIVRAYDMSGTALDFDKGDDESLTYGEYLAPDQINKYSATQVLSARPGSKEFKEIADKLAGKIVIIGGSWHQRAFGRGPRIDQRSTPVGDIPGVFMHANYVEALLDTRYHQPLSKKLLVVLEVILGLVTAVVVAKEFWWVWKILLVAGLILVLMLFAIVSLQILGSFFDFFIPVVMVIGHAVYEQVKDWRKAALNCARNHHTP